MGFFGAKKSAVAQSQVVAAGASPLWRRIPITFVGSDSVILDDYSKVCSFIVEPPGMEGIDEEVISLERDKVANILKNLPAQNAFVQFTSVMHRDLARLFAKHKSYSDGNMLLKSITAERLKMLSDSIDTSMFVSITVPLSAGITVEGKKRKYITDEDFMRRDREASEASKLIVDTLTPLGYSVSRLSGPDYMKALCAIINPHEPVPDMAIGFGRLLPLKQRIFLSDFFVDDFYITNGKYYFASLVMDTQPDPIPPMTGSRIMRELDFPCLYNVTILVDEQNRLMAMLEGQRKMAVMFSGKKSAAAVENAEKVRAIDDLRQDKAREGWKLCRTFTSFLVWDRDKKALQEKISNVRTAASKVIEGSGIFAEWMRKESAFIASLPGCATRSYDMLFTPSFDAAGLVPLRGQFKGDHEDPLLVYRNRWKSITAINPFSKKQNKWAGIIVGPSGSGKSFFMNSFMLGAKAANPFVMIIDMATMPSYEPFVNLMNGSFISVNLSDEYRVNMFDLRVGFEEPVGSKILSLDAMLGAMLTENEGKGLTKESQAVLNRAIKRLYTRVFKEEPKKVASINRNSCGKIAEAVFMNAPSFEYLLEYRDYYINRFKESGDQQFYNKAEMAQSLATPTLQDFAQTLASDEALVAGSRDREITENIRRVLSLYVSGTQSVLFNGVTNLVINNDVYCFHLGMIKERRDLLSMLILLYRDFAFRKAIFYPNEIPPFIEADNARWIVSMQKRPKLFLYDEFHNLKGHSSLNIIMDILDKDARQQRTLGMATYLATQEIGDIAGTGKNFLSASANKYFTRHISPENPNMQAIDDVVDHLGLNAEERELLKGVTFYPGKYAEVLALSEDIGKGIIQYTPTSAERWCFTTHKDERYVRDNIVKALIAKGCDMGKAQVIAITALSRICPAGSVGKVIDVDEVMKKIETDGYLS